MPPEAPLPSDCCDSGCDPCVHDTYAEEMDWYRQQLARWRERNPGADGAGADGARADGEGADTASKPTAG